MTAQLLDLVAATDAQWFRDHPIEELHYRPMVPGEFDIPGEYPAGTWMVEVRQIVPGIRLRRPYIVLSEVKT